VLCIAPFDHVSILFDFPCCMIIGGEVSPTALIPIRAVEVSPFSKAVIIIIIIIIIIYYATKAAQENTNIQNT